LIVWVNGAFGSGKSTLAEELRARMPDAVVFDPEYVGYIITQWVPAPTGDFQDLPIWRHLVIETALALRKFHAEVLIVPMTLVDERYYGEVVGGLCGTGEQVAHVFLDLPAEVLRRRIEEQILNPADAEQDAKARAFRLKNVDRCVAAAARQSADTLMLRSDLQTPAQLADAVMAHLT
jgi:hypothetical protein